MSENNILRTVDEGILTLTINRPNQLNALNSEVISSLSKEIVSAQTDDEVRIIIITGAGEKAFVAGADIKEFADFTPSQGKDLAALGQATLFDRVERSFKPVIAAVNGFALGGGCEMAMACDFIIACEDAKFGQPEINVGAIPGAGGSQRMPRFIGKSKAMYAILTGDIFDAEEAEKAGLVAKIYKKEDFEKKVVEIASKIASKSSALARLAKESVNLSFETPLEEGLRAERSLFYSTFALEDHTEGMNAFADKRKPIWKNK